MTKMRFTPRTMQLRAIVKNARNFAVALDMLKAEGLDRGRAILLARKYDGKGYSQWMAARNRLDDGRLAQFQTL